MTNINVAHCHFQALLSVHDTVAQKNYDPVLPPMPDDIDEEEDSVKIIRLVKNREPLVGYCFFHFFFFYYEHGSWKMRLDCFMQIYP